MKHLLVPFLSFPYGVWCQVYQVKKQQKGVKRIVVKSVVGTLDLNVRYLLLGETFPGVSYYVNRFFFFSFFLF